MKRLTIEEYANLYGITKQAVYKKINKLPTEKEKRNGKNITIILLDDEEFQRIEAEVKQPNSTNSTSTVEKVENAENEPAATSAAATTSTEEKQPYSTVEYNREIIELLKNQLNEKDKQIEQLQKATEEKDRQLQEQFNRLTSLLGRSQELEALLHRQLTAGEQEPLQDEDITDTADKKPEEPTKKKGFLKRLFGIKD